MNTMMLIFVIGSIVGGILLLAFICILAGSSIYNLIMESGAEKTRGTNGLPAHVGFTKSGEKRYFPEDYNPGPPWIVYEDGERTILK